MTDALTPADEIRLARRIETGLVAARLLAPPVPEGITTDATAAELERLVTEGRQALAELVAGHRGLAAWEAHRWAAREGLDVDELVQEGCLGLAVAAERWDWASGHRFTTYAIHWIRKRIRAAAATRCGQLAVSETAGLQMRRGLRDRTIAAHAHALASALPIFDEEGALVPLPAPEASDDDALVARALASLDPAARRIMLLRVGWSGAPMSLAAVATATGLSKQTVAAIERRAIARMRTSVALLDHVA